MELDQLCSLADDLMLILIPLSFRFTDAPLGFFGLVDVFIFIVFKMCFMVHVLFCCCIYCHG